MHYEGDGAAFAEQSLVQAARDGSVAAFTRLYEEYAPHLLHLLTYQLADRELAADLVQDTFADAWHSLNRLPVAQPFAPWLYTIARHNRLAAVRRERMRRALSLDWLRGRAEPVEPARFAERAGEVAVLRGVLNTLPPALREVLVLHDIGGYTTHEIAAILGLSRDAARQRLTRGRREFARRYERLREL